MRTKFFQRLMLMFAFGILLYSHSVSAVENFNEASGLRALGETAGYDKTDSNFNIISAVGYYINIFLSFIAVIFLSLMIYSGYTWMMSQGVQTEVTKAKTLIKQAIIGLIIVMSAYAITEYAAYYLGGNRL